MAEGVRKKKVRSGNRIFVKRIIGNVSELASAELSGETTIKLQTHKKSLESKLKVLSELNQEILEMMEDEKEMEKEICDAGDFESLKEETILKIYLLLGKQLKNKMATAKESQTSAQQSLPSTSDGHEGQMTSQFAGPKLSKFKLPTFDGDSSRWLEFWDSFEAAIRRNPKLAAAPSTNPITFVRVWKATPLQQLLGFLYQPLTTRQQQ